MTCLSFVTPTYYPRKTGVALHVTEISQEFARRGYKVIVYVQGPRKDYYFNNVQIRRFPYISITRAYNISASFFKSILKHNCDLIHSHHYGYFPATAGFISSKLKKVPHVFTPHFHPPIYNTFRKMLHYFYFISQGFFIINFSDKILPHSFFEKYLIEKKCIKEVDIEVVPSTINTNKFRPLKNVKKEKMILFVGPLIKEKGVHILFKIAKKLSNVKVVFIGVGEFEDKLKQEAMKAKNILFFKNIPDEELVKWYNKASILVLPSKYEAFGRVLAEAQSCETPVVATKVGAIPEVVLNKKTGYVVEYGNWDEFENKILKLLENKTLQQKMGYFGRKHVIKNFNIKVIVNKLDKIYNELL